MGTQSTIDPTRQATGFFRIVLSATLGILLSLASLSHAQTISALTSPLLLPTSIAFDAQGNLYLAETNNHVIRRVDPTGVLTTIAGNGTQGFSGDGGPATSAQLDSPTGIVLDAANNLYFADSHNHRLRKVDATTGTITTIAGNGTPGFSGDGGAATLASLDLPTVLAIDSNGNLYLADTNNHRIRKLTATTGLITTVAGNGLQQFSGDGGPATAASIDSPSGLAVDSAGNLYLADTHNHRLRMVSAATGLISTIAGTGAPGFSGDTAAATAATLALPHGLSIDASGNIYFADTNNHRIRRISPEGIITTVAGDGTQAFSGDGGAAIAASLDTPRSTALSPAGLLTLADTGNERVRQISSSTIGGQGATAPVTLAIAGPSATLYGTGTLTVTLTTLGSASGLVTLAESTATGTNTLGTATIAANIAMISTAPLVAGQHHLFATYSGDITHQASQSTTTLLTISPVLLTASVTSASVLYGQPIPVLSGSLNGVLAQDAGKISLVLTTTAAVLSPVGTYPITAALKGPAAGNYTLAPLAGAVLAISKAPSSATLSASATSVAVGLPLSLSVHIASTTTGTPTGSITLLDGGTALTSLPLSSTDSAAFTTSTLTTGSHALAAVYAGDSNFTGSTAAAQTITISAPTPGDFTLTATGSTSQTIPAGNAASFTFAVQSQGAALASPITLASSGLPTGTTTTFSPTYLPPGGSITTFTLTIQTTKPTTSAIIRGQLTALAILLLPLLPLAQRSRRGFMGALCLVLVVFAAGCGDRIYTTSQTSAAPTSYPILVSGTATSPTGSVLQHTATVTLTIQ